MRQKSVLAWAPLALIWPLFAGNAAAADAAPEERPRSQITEGEETPQGARSDLGDLWTTSSTKMRLYLNRETPGGDINVDSRKGVVTLFGLVPSQEAKRMAETEALKVGGVSAVVNELQVVSPERFEDVKAEDARLVSRVETALAKEEDLGESNIDVEVADGVARLTGTVPTEREMLAAAVLTRSIPGIQRVRSELEVSSELAPR